jgi:hypothetical protein
MTKNNRRFLLALRNFEHTVYCTGVIIIVLTQGIFLRKRGYIIYHVPSHKSPRENT